MLLPSCVNVPNSVILGRAIWAKLWRSARKFWPVTPRLSRSLKVIGTDTDRSATYDFLLVFHSNYGPISYRFQDNWQYLQNLPTHVYFVTSPPPLRVSPWNFVTAVGPENTGMTPLTQCQKSATHCSISCQVQVREIVSLVRCFCTRFWSVAHSCCSDVAVTARQCCLTVESVVAQYCRRYSSSVELRYHKTFQVFICYCKLACQLVVTTTRSSFVFKISTSYIRTVLPYLERGPWMYCWPF